MNKNDWYAGRLYFFNLFIYLSIFFFFLCVCFLVGNICLVWMPVSEMNILFKTTKTEKQGRTQKWDSPVGSYN